MVHDGPESRRDGTSRNREEFPRQYSATGTAAGGRVFTTASAPGVGRGQAAGDRGEGEDED